MKRPKDDVFRLIKSMTPAEKRYFKRHFASDRSSQTDLFDFLNSQTEYDEEQVKQYFGGKMAKNLKVNKNQLLQLVLKSLSAFHSKRNVVSKIRAGLEEVDILLEKSLFDMARETLGRVKELCLRYEEFTYLIEVLQREFRLQHTHVDKPGLSGHPVFQELEDVLCHLGNHLRLFRLATELIERDRSRGDHPLTDEERRAFHRIRQEDPSGDCQSLPSFREQVSRNIVLTLVHEFLDGSEAGGAFRRGNVELFEAFPHFKESMSFNYLGVLRNYLNFCLEGNCREKGPELIERARSVIKNNPKLEYHLGYLWEAELRIAFDQGQLEAVTGKLEKDILAFVRKNRTEGERITLNMFVFLALAHIAVNNPRQAQYYLRMLRENAQGDLHHFFFELLEILDMISHFESGDDFLVSNILVAIQRRQGASTGYDPLFGLIQDLFRGFIRFPERRRELMEGFLTASRRRPPSRLSLELQYFRIMKWFEAVSQGKTLEEVLRAAGKTGNFASNHPEP